LQALQAAGKPATGILKRGDAATESWPLSSTEYQFTRDRLARAQPDQGMDDGQRLAQAGALFGLFGAGGQQLPANEQAGWVEISMRAQGPG